VKAAQIDGATGWRLYLHVILPQLRTTLLSAVVILTHLAIKSYLFRSCALEWHIVGNFLDTLPYNPVHHTHVLGKATARRLKSGRDSDLLVDGTLRVQLPAAVEAVETRNVMECNDTIAGNERTHARSHFDDNSCRFMPVDAGGRQEVVLNLFKVGMADPTTLNPHKQFAWSNTGHGNRPHRH
jgi:hypothetical protein